MNGGFPTYLCLRESGGGYQLLPAESGTRAGGGAGHDWYFITSRPLDEFVVMRIFGSYRDLQSAYSAMMLVDPSIEGPM